MVVVRIDNNIVLSYPILYFVFVVFIIFAFFLLLDFIIYLIILATR